jgi:hypothetical protein
MRILKSKAAGIVGAVAVATIAGQAHAQASSTVTMGVTMTISQAASAAASPMAFGSVIPVPNGTITLSPAGAVTGTGMYGSASSPRAVCE